MYCRSPELIIKYIVCVQIQKLHKPGNLFSVTAEDRKRGVTQGWGQWYVTQKSQIYCQMGSSSTNKGTCVVQQVPCPGELHFFLSCYRFYMDARFSIYLTWFQVRRKQRRPDSRDVLKCTFQLYFFSSIQKKSIENNKRNIYYFTFWYEIIFWTFRK